MAQLVISLVIIRIDYCNSMLAGLPAFRLVPLQGVQNAAARLVLNLDRRAHISPALQQLHWLPVKHRVTFNVQDSHIDAPDLTKTFPSYLADMVTFNMTYSQSQRCHLRSSATRSAALRSSRTQFGKRAFSRCGPDVWNNSYYASSSTVIQFSDVHSSHIYLAVLFPHNCYPLYSLTL